MPENEKRNTISRSILIGCASLIAALGLLLALQLNHVISNTVYEQYRTKLRDVVTVVEGSTDADDLRACIRTATPSPKYDALQKLLNRYVGEFGIDYIYIVIPGDTPDGTMISVVSSASRAEIEAARAVGRSEDGLPILYDESGNYTRGQVQPYLDAWNAVGQVSFFEDARQGGVCYTGCKPLVTSDGETIALIGADCGIDEVRGTIISYVARNVALAVAVCALFGLLLTLWMRRNVIKPIQALEQSTLRFVKLCREGADISDLKLEAGDAGASSEFRLLFDAMNELTRAKQETAEAKAARDLYSNIAQALSANYMALYYVETETGNYVSYQQNRLGDQSGTDFFGSSKLNFAPSVVEEDREAFIRELEKDNVLRTLEEHGEMEVSYRIKSGDAIIHCKTHIAPMPGDAGHLLIGMDADRNIDKLNEVTGLRTGAALSVIGRRLLHANPDWCVLALDLEHFKLFNEWYGREMGDQLLAQIGELLKQVEKTTGGLACYLGQDDFALVMPYDAEQVKRLFGDIHGFIIKHGTSVGFMPAVGICFADGRSSVQELLDRALRAAQYAKEDYHNRIRIFEEAMYQKTERDYQILSDFQQALRGQEMFIQLQPQCRIDDGRIMGAESLARWRKADGTIVSPGVFVPVLEQYGFVTDLDQFVWKQVCAWQRTWIDGGHTPLPVSVNVSQIDIFTIDVPAYFEQLLREYRLPVDAIKIEITESAYVGDDKVADTVRRLREKGFIVLMDDFGSGYSSLNMLRNLSVDVIKLDAQFLRMNSDDRKGVRILESIVAMARSMEAAIIVEGVETKKESEFIRSLGCRYVQGYYFYRPMSVTDFEALISDEGNLDTEGFRR